MQTVKALKTVQAGKVSGRKTYVDKKTGLKYELLPGSDKKAVKAYKATKGKGLGINEMFKYTDLAENFDGFDFSIKHLEIFATSESSYFRRRTASCFKEIERVLKREKIQRIQRKFRRF